MVNKLLRISMRSSGFNKYGIDAAGIHWGQHLSISFSALLLIFIGLDREIPFFHDILRSILTHLECSGLNCNGY